MIDYHNQIIEKEEDNSPKIQEAKKQVLVAMKERINPASTMGVEDPFTKEECWLALQRLGKEKFLN